MTYFFRGFIPVMGTKPINRTPLARNTLSKRPGSKRLMMGTKGEADSLRKAMGKKKKSIMDEMKVKFMEGCIKKGYDEAIITKIWSDW